MQLLTVQSQTYHLAQLVRYRLHTGQREVGAKTNRLEPLPLFADFQFAELLFSDGSRVELVGAQTEAFLKHLEKFANRLDLDQVETRAVGTVLVHDTAEGGDIVIPREPESQGSDSGVPFEPGVFPPLR